MKKIAIYPGTFDPITLGHLDVIRTSAAIFDKVFVALLVNPKKKPMFTEEHRLIMIKEVIESNNLTNVQVESSSGLTADLARKKAATVIIRGLRLATEYEEELKLSFNNRILNNNLQTIFIAPLQNHIHISSSAVRELISFGKTNLVSYVPGVVLDQIN